MIRTLSAAAALIALTAQSCFAQEINRAAEPVPLSTQMTDAERNAVGEMAAEYFRQHPDVLMDIILTYREKLDAGEKPAAASPSFVLSTDPRIGAADADTTIIEFIDHGSDASVQAHEAAESAVAEGHIMLVSKEFPVSGEASVTAARYALEAYKAGKGYSEISREINLGSKMTVDYAAELLKNSGASDEQKAAAVEDIRASRGLAERLKISVLPTVIVEHKGRTTVLIGDVTKAKILEAVSKLRGQ